MYIFEIFVKWLNKNKRGVNANPDRLFQGNTKKLNIDDNNESINCEHKFMPVDSTGEVLACVRCGLVIKKNNKKDN